MIALDVRVEAFPDPVGILTSDDYGSTRFAYRDEYLSLGSALPISMSLPLRDEPFEDGETRAFFQNILQENDQLNQVMERENIDRNDVVRLLYFLGSDCPGAISCLPVGSHPFKRPGLIETDYDFLNVAEVGEIVRRLANHEPLPNTMPDPSPVAGVQPKIAILHTTDGRYAFPKPGLGVPTTHILKVPRTIHHREPILEASAAHLAKFCGLDVSIPRLVEYEGHNALLISRFDRDVKPDGTVRRVHQEDFAQALGLPASFKYERYGRDRRIFNVTSIATVLARTSEPARSLSDFICSTMFNIAIGNSDNHAKNYALLYEVGPAPRLAPLYDLLPIRMKNDVTHELSFRIGTADYVKSLKIEDFAQYFLELKFKPRAADRFIKTKVISIMAGIDRGLQELEMIPKDFKDFVAQELAFLVNVLQLDVKVRARDFFQAKAGGWAAS